MHSKVVQQWHFKVGHPGGEVSGAGLAMGCQAIQLWEDRTRGHIMSTALYRYAVLTLHGSMYWFLRDMPTFVFFAQTLQTYHCVLFHMIPGARVTLCGWFLLALFLLLLISWSLFDTQHHCNVSVNVLSKESICEIHWEVRQSHRKNAMQRVVSVSSCNFQRAVGLLFIDLIACFSR